MFKKMADRTDRRAWADLEARLLEDVAQENRLDRLVVVQMYGNPPVKPADDGYLYFTPDFVYYAPRKNRDVYGFALERILEHEWQPAFDVLALHVALEGERGTVASFGFKPHMTPWSLTERALDRLAAATEARPPLPENDLWPTE